jgi:hypothetical protein
MTTREAIELAGAERIAPGSLTGIVSRVRARAHGTAQPAFG